MDKTEFSSTAKNRTKEEVPLTNNVVRFEQPDPGSYKTGDGRQMDLDNNASGTSAYVIAF